MLLRLLQGLALFATTLVMALAGSIVLERHTPDPSLVAAYVGLIAAIIALIATYRDKK